MREYQLLAVLCVRINKMAWYHLYLAVLITATAAQTPFTLEDFLSGAFSQRGFNGVWISDNEFTFTSYDPLDRAIRVYNASSDEISILVSNELMETLDTQRPILSADRHFILAPSEQLSVYRYSTTAKYALYEIETEDTTEVAGHERLQLCIFGGGHSLAYVLDNDLYYLPENAAAAIRLTSDGEPGVIYNGHTDWVYEEDVMYTGQATWFSPGGTYLAFASFDDTEVDSYSYYYYVDKSDPEDVYPELFDLKYPKVGTTNPTVLLRVLPLTGLVASPDGNYPWVVLAAPAEVTEDHILGGVTWTTDEEVAALWLNRRQNVAVLRIFNMVTSTFVDEHLSEPDGWVPISMPRFSENGDFYMSLRWSMEQADGQKWQHLFMSVRAGENIVSNSITPGDFTVDTFLGMNEEELLFYFTRTIPGQPWRREVHELGSGRRCLSCDLRVNGNSCTWASGALSHSGAYAAITCHTPDHPSVVFIYDVQNRIVLRTWEDNSIVQERLADKLLPNTFIDTVPLDNGVQVPYRLMLPPDLDVDDVDTKYPMIFYVYSGPNTNTVQDTFTVGYHSYLTTNRSVIYLMADGRGSGRQGQDMLFALNNALGTVEIEDHSVILRRVLERHQYIDPTRVGIWGHSYGGYATLLTLAHDDDELFKCGISTAPVTSWLYYNTMYTERYMGLPTEDDNLDGYMAGDVTLLAENLRDKKFLLMHGNADDNVHFQNAAKLMTSLQQLNIDFEQMSYPDEAHSLAGVNLHRYSTMDRFWAKCLDIPI